MRAFSPALPPARRPTSVNAFTPAQLASLSQWFNPSYAASLLGNIPYLTPLETGSLAIPRGARCALFDGMDDHGIAASVSFDLSSDWTISFKTKITTFDTYCYLFGFGDAVSTGMDVYVNGSTGRIGYKALGELATPVLSLNTWYTITLKRSSSLVHLYVDGVAYGNWSATNSTATSGDVLVGAIDYTTLFYTGVKLITDVRMYSGAKSDAAILAMHNQHLTPNDVDTTGLVAAWALQEESGTKAFDWSGNGNDLTLTNITQSTFHATDAGVKWNYNNSIGHTVNGSVIVPANASDLAEDAEGNPLGVTGPIKYPAVVTPPCVTGDGIAANIALGDLSLSITQLSMTIKLSSDNQLICTLQNSTTTAISVVAGVLTFGGSLTVSAINIDGVVVSAATAGATLNDNFWHRLVLTLSSISCSNVKLLTDSSAFGSVQIGDVQFIGSSTTYIPCQEGAGRDIAVIKSDGTGSVISNALVNGTLSAVWANTCPIAKDWSTLYGGGISAGNAFIAGLIGSGNDAAGNAKTLTAGKIGPPSGNPYTRLMPNYWGAPELNNIAYTSSTCLEQLPCLTCNASNVVANLGSQLIPLSGDFEFSIRAYIPASPASYAVIVGQDDGPPWVSVCIVFYDAGQWRVCFGSYTANYAVLNVTADAWNYIRVRKVGTTLYASVNGGAENTGTCLASITGSANTVFGKATGGAYFAGRVSDFQVTVGSNVTNVPFTEGSGADIAKYVNGVETVITNAVQGTLTNIWANKTDGKWAVKFGPEAMVPRNTKFRRVGSDRYVATREALTGADLTNMRNYML